MCGNRAFEGTGDEFIGSSSGIGEGEAFLFREEDVVDTTRFAAVSGMILDVASDEVQETYLIVKERGVCVHGSEEESAAWLGCSSLLVVRRN